MDMTTFNGLCGQYRIIYQLSCLQVDIKEFMYNWVFKNRYMPKKFASNTLGLHKTRYTYDKYGIHYIYLSINYLKGENVSNKIMYNFVCLHHKSFDMNSTNTPYYV